MRFGVNTGFSYPSGLLLTLQELAEQEQQRAEQERQRANKAEHNTWLLAEKLRAMGINPEDIIFPATNGA